MDHVTAEHYLSLAKSVKNDLEGPLGAKVADQLENENQQLAEALEWFIDRRDTVKAQALASILYRFLDPKGDTSPTAAN